MDQNLKVKRNDNFVFNEVDGELVMMNIETGGYVSLNESGKSIWNALEEPKNIQEIVQLLLAEYDVPEADCYAEVNSFMATMLEKEVLLKA